MNFETMAQPADRIEPPWCLEAAPEQTVLDRFINHGVSLINDTEIATGP